MPEVPKPISGKAVPSARGVVGMDSAVAVTESSWDGADVDPARVSVPAAAVHAGVLPPARARRALCWRARCLEDGGVRRTPTAAHRIGVHDEISPLRRVIVHGPGPELERLTPDSREELLFDEVLWRDRAEAQHREFTALLRGEGVEVLQLRSLLVDLLEEP